MAEIPLQSRSGVVAIALYPVRMSRRTASHAGRIHAPSQVGEKAVRFKTPARDRIEVQCLLVDFYLFLEPDRRERNKRLSGDAHPLCFYL